VLDGQTHWSAWPYGHRKWPQRAAAILMRACVLMCASTRQTLLVARICGPPAAISCSYRDTGVPCSVVGPFLCRPGGLELVIPDYLRDPSRSADSSPRPEVTTLWRYTNLFIIIIIIKTLLFSFCWHTQRIRGFAFI